jgi:hypothetical protein
MQHGGVPELLIALGYNGITGRLTVEVNSELNPLLNKFHHTFNFLHRWSKEVISEICS